nr:hypothetical protein [Chloroflexaceae bacterium]
RLGYPTRVSLGTSSAYAAAAEPDEVAVFTAYVEALRRPPPPGMLEVGQLSNGGFVYSYQYLYWFYRAVEEGLQGNDVEQALQQAQDRTSAFLACVRQGTAQPACAQQAAPDDPGWSANQ